MSTNLDAGAAAGLNLGSRTVEYHDRDAILYALAVGARATELELVFERELRVLPTFGLVHGLWACDVIGERGFFSQATAVHGSQLLEVLAPLPPSGTIELSGRVSAVWDKGTASIFDIEVACPYFRAVYSIFAPGMGGWGGERGPKTAQSPETRPSLVGQVQTWTEQAALYRLTGDRHLIHIDPGAARVIGQPRPILHGLCTLAAAVRELATMLGAEPWSLETLQGRFAAPVLPGEQLTVEAWDPDSSGLVPFRVSRGDVAVVDAGLVRFQ